MDRAGHRRRSQDLRHQGAQIDIGQALGKRNNRYQQLPHCIPALRLTWYSRLMSVHYVHDQPAELTTLFDNTVQFFVLTRKVHGDVLFTDFRECSARGHTRRVNVLNCT